MSYRQYTKCVSTDDFRGAPIANSVALGLFVALTALVTAMLATGGFSGLLAGAAGGIAIVTSLLAFTHWWLYGRLICLGGDRCAIGMVISVEPPSKKDLPFDRLDSDYSINLLLPPHQPGATQAQVIATGVDGSLIAEQAASHRHYHEFKGESARSCDGKKCGYANCPETASLHCEFEGAGMFIFYQWLKAVLALLVAGTVAAALCLVPVIGWVACLIAAIILAASAAALLAGLTHGLLDAASPSDVNPALGGELQQNACDGTGADIVVVSGEWVYDSLHEGWNEIHPIRHCEKIGTWAGTWASSFPSMTPFDGQALRDIWCRAVTAAGSPLTVANQKDPRNQWTVHPELDGCEPDGCAISLHDVSGLGEPLASAIRVAGRAVDCEIIEVSVTCAGSAESSVDVAVEPDGMWVDTVPVNGLDCKCGGPITVTARCKQNPDCVTQFESNHLDCVAVQ